MTEMENHRHIKTRSLSTVFGVKEIGSVFLTQGQTQVDTFRYI